MTQQKDPKKQQQPREGQPGDTRRRSDQQGGNRQEQPSKDKDFDKNQR